MRPANDHGSTRARARCACTGTLNEPTGLRVRTIGARMTCNTTHEPIDCHSACHIAPGRAARGRI
jgi:hypothetical protein